MSNSLLEAALAYAADGYSVFPCQPGGKAPACPRGCLEATADEATIRQWWTANPSANIGLSTTGLAVVDIDDTTWPADAALAGELARGAVQQSARGGRHHVFLQQPGKPVRNTASRIAHKVDSRGDGGYIVVSPSVFEGKQYRWLPGLELPPQSELPETPPLVQAELDRVANDVAPAAHSPAASIESFGEGERNSRLFSICCSLRRMGLSQSEIQAAALKINQERCKPQLDASEVETIAGSAAKYEPDAVATSEASNRKPIEFKRLTAAELDAGEYTLEYHLAGCMSVGQPLILAGPKKALKTSIMLDAFISIATGKPFLNTIEVTKPGRVAMMSGESGLATLQETCRRISRSKGIRFGDVNGFIISPDLPQIARAASKREFDKRCSTK